MVSGFISRLVILIFGTLYPAYASYKAVRTKNVKEYVKWMMYWIVFALFTCAETFTDLFLSFWFPFYYEIKIITVIYLLSPATKGSSILYRKFVHPVLTKKEQEIDEYIAKAKEQGYHTMLNLGSKGVNYATSLIMQTAIKGLPSLPITPSSDFLPTKSSDVVDFFDIEDDCSIKKELSENSLGQGGGGLMNQLRKSYSLGDLVGEQDGTVTDGEGPRRRRNLVHNAGQISGNYDGLYYPGTEFYEHSADADGETVISEGLSSGYSSGEPLHYGTRRPKGDVLIRTASLGPSSRVRTRAYTKNTLPKRTSFTEGGSTWSALESYESQNETDNFDFHLSHSASYPFPLTSCDPYLFSGYPYLIRNNKMFTVSNHSTYSQILNNDAVAFQNVLAGVLRYENNENSRNNSILLFEENSEKSTAIDSKSDVSNVTYETKVDDNIECCENPETENIKEEKIIDVKITDLDAEKEKAEEQNSLLLIDESLNEKEKSPQQRSGRYNKKPAPTPPAEESFLKLSDHTLKDESFEFYTPDSSPRPSRKQSLSEIDKTTDKDIISCGSSEVPQPKTQTAAVTEEVKKVKTKKGDFNISKKLHLPKMPFNFWDQKGGKQPSSSKTSSVGSAETATTKSESQSNEKVSVASLTKNNNEENNETLV